MTFLEALVKKGLIKDNQINEVKNLAKDKHEGDIDSALIEMGIGEGDILDAKGEFYSMPVKRVDPSKVAIGALKYIPEDAAVNYRFAPFGLSDGVLEVGITDPENIKAMDALQFISAKTGIAFKIYLISKKNYQGILDNYRGITTQVAEALSHIDSETQDDIEAKGMTDAIDLSKEIASVKPGDQARIVEDAPITKIVGVIIKNAIEGGASDIHIEHTGEKVKVRYRVDGTLHSTIQLPAKVHSGVVARVKIMSKLRLDEKRKPQDGSFSAVLDDGTKIDFRVSTMPSYYGEKVVIRILDSDKGVKPISQLGLSERNMKMIKEAIERPYGLILITGPTGSGKSTTLYSMLNELDKEKSNVVTLEDPVEYHMPDINQSQMMPEIGYTFASGLRSILRQDPDVIMVGEIRDKETAQLAIQAALTGHLVLSTLHTNNSIGAIPRLVDMGVDPYLIAPTLVLSIAQRLSKMTFPPCRKEVPMDPSIRLQVENQFKDLPEEFRGEIKLGDKMYDTVPVPECPSGTKGRIAIFEMFKIDNEIQKLILTNPIYSEIYKVARKKGMLSMKEDAMLKAIEGVIPFREVYNYTDEKE